MSANRKRSYDAAFKLAAVEDAGATDFRASRGWLEKFMKRRGFSLCRRTTVSQHLPKDLMPKVTMFIMATRRLRHSKDYPLGSIGNMDETPLWLVRHARFYHYHSFR